MPISTETVNIDVTLPDGAELPEDRAFVEFELTESDVDVTDNQTIPKGPIRVSLDADGIAAAELWPNDLGTRGTFYKVSVVLADERGIASKDTYYHFGFMQLEDGGGPYSLAAEVFSGLTPGAAGVVDLKGRLRLSDGTAALPSYSFTDDTDTGFYRPDANQIAGVTGGVRRTLLSSSAYQIDVPITASDRLDFDSPVTIGTNAAATTSDLAFSGSAVIGTENHISVGWESGGYMRWLDGITDSEGGNAGGTEVMRIDGEALTLNDVPSWAEIVTIADDAVAEITLPSDLQGYFISMVPYRTSGGIDSVQNKLAFIGQVDTGSTTAITEVFAGSDVETSGSTLTGTTGTDGKMTIAATDNGTILIENRMGDSRTCPVRIW